MNMYKKIFITIICFFAIVTANAQTELKRIEKDVRYLSSDEMKGRFPGSDEEKKAAKYIIKQFKALKLIMVMYMLM